MFQRLSAIVVLQMLVLMCRAQLDTTGLAGVLSDHLPHVEALVAKRIIPNRYMCVGDKATKLGITDTIPGWTGYSVELYEYTVDDKLDGHLTTQVYLLNADAQRIARWVISACWLVKRAYNEDNILKIIRQINRESNGQFPVRGIVYEDIFPKDHPDSIQETYPFFDGVTTERADFAIHTPQRATPEQRAKYLSMTAADIGEVHTYGRIISTTREDYALLFPTVNTKSSKWCVIVREEYQKALKSDINWLIVAWVDSHREEF